jgi:hypothetical protein
VLFRKSEEKREERRAHAAELQAEADRLTALSPEAQAVKLLPIVATESAKSKFTGVKLDEMCKGLLGGLQASFRVNVFGLKLQLKQPILEALQRLEHANLIVEVPGTSDFTYWRITAEGEQTVASGNIAEKLSPSIG